VAFIYIAGFVFAAIAAVIVLWIIWPPLAGAFVGYLLFREFMRH